jgi:hypothetical protein
LIVYIIELEINDTTDTARPASHVMIYNRDDLKEKATKNTNIGRQRTVQKTRQSNTNPKKKTWINSGAPG